MSAELKCSDVGQNWIIVMSAALECSYSLNVFISAELKFSCWQCWDVIVSAELECSYVSRVGK